MRRNGLCAYENTPGPQQIIRVKIMYMRVHMQLLTGINKPCMKPNI